MALLICPECGYQVSDKATECLNCGYPVSNIIAAIKAEEQEKELAKKAKIKKRKKKIIITLLILLVIFAALAIVTFLFLSKPERRGLYDGNKWKMSYSDIKEKYPDGFKSDGGDDYDKSYITTVDEFESIEGTTALVSFEFLDDELCEVYIWVMVDDDEISYEKLEKQLKRHYDELFGEGSSSDYTITWETRESSISLFKYKSLITVTYKYQ